jgi:hypothetical protein
MWIDEGERGGMRPDSGVYGGDVGKPGAVRLEHFKVGHLGLDGDDPRVRIATRKEDGGASDVGADVDDRAGLDGFGESVFLSREHLLEHAQVGGPGSDAYVE